MSCSTGSCSCSKPSCACGNAMCPAIYVGWLPRIAFGLVLVGYGVNHYRNLSGFVGMAKGVFTIGFVSSIAGMLAYIVPALMIVGGVLFALKQLCCVSKTCIIASLSGIIGWAGLAVLLGDGNAAGQMMPMIQNTALLFVLYYVIKKMSCKKCCCAKPADMPCSK